MKYMGSKDRIAKHLLPIILKNRKPGQWYVEPFVGGANMIDKVYGKRLGADSNEYLIACLEMIRDNPKGFPKNNNETNVTIYKEIKKYEFASKHGFVRKAMCGYYGFALSYGGKWFGGWCRDGANRRDYVAEAYRNAINQSFRLYDIEFIWSNYINLDIPQNSIVYCDPPYSGATKYKDDFDHNIFWDWCREKSKEGHNIFISEYSAPIDFKCLWQKEIVCSLTKNTGGKKGVEKLFTINSEKENIIDMKEFANI